MAPFDTNPRRRPQKPTGQSPDTRRMLRKSETFSPRSPLSSPLLDNPLDSPRMPKRSPTCTKALENLILKDEESLTSADKVKKLLKDFDHCMTGKPSHNAGSILKEGHISALPGLFHRPAPPQRMDIDKPAKRIHCHDSDSGIGSSVSTAPGEEPTRGSVKSVSTTHTAVTKSAFPGWTLRSHEDLSPRSARQIKKLILQPLLDDSTLSEFHDIVDDIPRRIDQKDIVNLRDLEKTLLSLACEFSTSSKSYLKFCETAIHCLYNSVEYICDRDRCLPGDRPYNHLYFVDLVEQIRRYAEIMASSNRKRAAGQELDEMDYSPDEVLALEGGVTVDGQPAHLVRKKDGKTIPLSTPSSAPKRALSPDMEDDEGVHRSMARRRKSDKAGDVVHYCTQCDKTFPRHCDLSKHEKTHSRPWKCDVESCRYHELGWPTEKERDRHHNDKHSAQPVMHECQYNPCTYRSKRESNLKQHMEKSHGFEYHRMKRNGKNRATAGPSTVASSSNQAPFFAESPFQQSAAMTPSTAGPSHAVSPALDNAFPFGRELPLEPLTTFPAHHSPVEQVMGGSAFDEAWPEHVDSASLFEPLDPGFYDAAFTAQDFGNMPVMNTPAMSVDLASPLMGNLNELSPNITTPVMDPPFSSMNDFTVMMQAPSALKTTMDEPLGEFMSSDWQLFPSVMDPAYGQEPQQVNFDPYSTFTPQYYISHGGQGQGRH